MSSGRFSTLPARVAVSAVAIPLIVWISMLGGYPFALFIALCSGLALHEFYGLARAKGTFPHAVSGLGAGALVSLSFVLERFEVDMFGTFRDLGVYPPVIPQTQFLLTVLLLFVIVTALIELFRDKGSPILNAGATIAGVLLIPLFFGTLIGLRELFPESIPFHRFFPGQTVGAEQYAAAARWGGYTVVSLLATIWICDTAAYFVGSWIGKHRLFERVSPKKSWEGAIAGFLAAILTMAAARYAVLEYLALGHAVVIGIIVGTLGQIGDLVESRFKRDAGLKDSSTLIPGHGGVYDRFDSLVFISPIVYLYMSVVIFS